MRFALEHVFFSQDCQKDIIKLVADDLDKLSQVEPLDWLGNPLRPPQPPRKRPIQWSLPDIISADRKPEDDPDATVVKFDQVSAELRRIAETGTGLHCIFAVILCILLCDNLMDMIVAGTPQNVCDQYFDGFEMRITKALCGEMGYANDSKSGRVVHPAKAPCQIAIDELMFVETIYVSHNLKASHPSSNKF